MRREDEDSKVDSQTVNLVGKTNDLSLVGEFVSCVIQVMLCISAKPSL